MSDFKLVFLVSLCAVMFVNVNSIKRGYYSFPQTRFYKRFPPFPSPSFSKSSFSYPPPIGSNSFFNEDSFNAKIASFNKKPLFDDDSFSTKFNKPSFDNDFDSKFNKPSFDVDFNTKFNKPVFNNDDLNNFNSKFNNKPSSGEFDAEYVKQLGKFFSKEDLDKIVGFGDNDKFKGFKKDLDIPIFNPETGTYKTETPFVNINEFKVKYSTESPFESKFPTQDEVEKNFNFINEATQTKFIYTNPSDINNMFSSPQNYQDQKIKLTDVDFEVQQNNVYNQPQIIKNHEEIFVNPNENSNNIIYTDSTNMKDEELPKPLNLRQEDDYETSFSNQVSQIAKAESYKVESFKDLPLMNHDNSKLDTVSSYYVPHYTVTTTKSQKKPSYTKPAMPSVPIEPAPPGYSGKDQSDAHLKAIKIWTHRSRGTAYTLHDDGTLSVEKPKASKSSYGYAS